MREINDTIATFCGWFKQNLDKIGDVDERLFKKILYVSWLDALAKSVYPKKGNPKRFTGFVQKFCDWPERDKVSLLHLHQYLHLNPDPEFETLRIKINQQYNGWRASDKISISNDPDFATIAAKWPKGADQALIHNMKHLKLFYRYRNALVHELKPPGYALQSPEEYNDKPFYYPLPSESSEEIIWNLAYPVKFFHRLCDTSLFKLKEYLVDNQIDPNNSYTFGPFWLDYLNK